VPQTIYSFNDLTINKSTDLLLQPDILNHDIKMKSSHLYSFETFKEMYLNNKFLMTRSVEKDAQLNHHDKLLNNL